MYHSLPWRLSRTWFVLHFDLRSSTSLQDSESPDRSASDSIRSLEWREIAREFTEPDLSQNRIQTPYHLSLSRGNPFHRFPTFSSVVFQPALEISSISVFLQSYIRLLHHTNTVISILNVPRSSLAIAPALGSSCTLSFAVAFLFQILFQD
jgi:hypothetical protein